jgi:chemotaxis signal transduction protein
MRTQLLRFWVPDVAVSLGLSARQVVEFSTDPPVTVIPGAHPALPGVAVWRGEPVAILDLGLALGLSTRPAPCRRLLMVQVDRSVGLVAIPTGDAMPRLQGVSEFQPASNRSGVPPDLVRGVFEDSAGRMAVPDLASIVQSPSFS